MKAKNPKFTRHGDIDLEVEHPEYGWIPFTASSRDTSKVGMELFLKASEGEFGEITPYDKEDEIKLLSREVKAMRDSLLSKSDWTQLPDIDPRLKEMYVPYRKELRDLTSQDGFPLKVQWPEEPKFDKG